MQKIPSHKKQRQCVISGFCCKADENCALLKLQSASNICYQEWPYQKPMPIWTRNN